MKINKDLVLKANIILAVIVLLDELIIIGAYQGIMAAQPLLYELQKNLLVWLTSAIMINLLFVLPLSLWVNEKEENELQTM